MKRIRGFVLALVCAGATAARADAVTDWNIKAGDLVVETRVGTPVAVSTMALVQTAAYRAV